MNTAQDHSKPNRSSDRESAPKISVIIPIYNVEKYLRTCLDSLVKQSLESIEFICVNDGSTDDSPTIMREYADRDERFVIITGPNKGYGHAVNEGLHAARGEYVGIVEPDDWVNPHMYEELYSAAALYNGEKADVVKSSYWNFYDLEDGTPPYIEKSNMMEKMPHEKAVFDIHVNDELLYQHPSIWSAIYLRDFLEAKGIRMMEAPGAGWVDNPFLFETLCQARQIVWIPSAYYFYRQTNPHASSYLKDYRIPFERLNDIRSFLRRTEQTDPKVLVSFYNRTFDYIKQVLEKFRFPEIDPELFALIRSSLEQMDPTVLYGAKRGIRRDQIEYYEDVMGITAKKISAHPACQNPLISIVMSMRNVRPYILNCLNSIISQTCQSFEVIAVDCSSSDRTVEVTSYVANKDLRFTLMCSASQNIADGFSQGLQATRGEIVLFIDPRTTMDSKLLRRVSRAFSENPSLEMLFYAKGFKYLPAALEKQIERAGKHALLINPQGIRDRLMICAPNSIVGKACSRSFISKIPRLFDQCEGTRCALTSTRLIAHAKSVGLMTCKTTTRQHYRQARTALAYINNASTLELARRAKFNLLYEYVSSANDVELLRGFHCYAVEAVLHDLSEIEDVDEERRYLSRLKKDCLDRYSIFEYPDSHFYNIVSFHKLQRIAHMDYPRYLERETRASRERTRIISESTAYRIGKKIAQVGPRLLPKTLSMKVRKRV